MGAITKPDFPLKGSSSGADYISFSRSPRGVLQAATRSPVTVFNMSPDLVTIAAWRIPRKLRLAGGTG